MQETEYLARRAQQELEAAIGTANKRARQIHLELADAYSSMLHERTRRSSFASTFRGSGEDPVMNGQMVSLKQAHSGRGSE